MDMDTSTESASGDAGVLTPEYMASLLRLCRLRRPTLEDITAIFTNEFRAALGGSVPEPPVPMDVPSTSRGPSPPRGSRKRKRGGRKSEFATTADGAEEEYDRPCTWEPGVNRCWLVDDLDLWNPLLSTAFVELIEVRWGELSLRGYAAKDLAPTPLERVLRVSLLIHLLLKIHRCVQRVEVDMVLTKLEEAVFWDAVHNCAGVRDHFEFHSQRMHFFRPVFPGDAVRWARSIATLKGLRSLTLVNMRLNKEAAEILGRYLAETTDLDTLNLSDIEEVGGDGILTLLNYLASNLSVKSMELTREMLEDQAGEALGNVVRRHVALNKLEINGSTIANPTAVLKAAVESPSLKTLVVNECRLSWQDIVFMGSALTRGPPSRASVLGGASASKPPTSVLENLFFTRCRKEQNEEERDDILEFAFSRLISGGLRQLSLNDCRLTPAFGGFASRILPHDSRLQHLYIQNNDLDLSGIRVLLKSLGVNTTLDVLGIDMRHHLDQFAVYSVITEHNLSSRLIFSWENPIGPEFVRGHNLCAMSSACLYFDGRVPVDIQVVLDELRKCTRTKHAEIYCTVRSLSPVPTLLASALKNMRHLRTLKLCFPALENYVVHVFVGLRENRSIQKLTLSNISFGSDAIEALAQLVQRNRTITVLSVQLQYSGIDNWLQLKAIRSRLKEVIMANRFITNLTVGMADVSRASDYQIKEALRRNMMLVTQAIRYIYGATGMTETRAFDTLRHSASLKSTLSDYYHVEDVESDFLIGDARTRLAANYIFHTGIVKSKVECYPRFGESGERIETIDSLYPECLALVCRYLSLGDVANP